MDEITPTEQMQQARRFKQIYSRYQQNRDLITVGAYQAGSDQRVDEAIRLYPILEQFLSQDSREAVSLAQSAEALQIVTGN
jgi:flagellum-specific ATP synthase